MPTDTTQIHRARRSRRHDGMNAEGCLNFGAGCGREFTATSRRSAALVAGAGRCLSDGRPERLSQREQSLDTVDAVASDGEFDTPAFIAEPVLFEPQPTLLEPEPTLLEPEPTELEFRSAVPEPGAAIGTAVDFRRRADGRFGRPGIPAWRIRAGRRRQQCNGRHGRHRADR